MRNRNTADHVRMPVQILRRRMHDDVEPQLERPLYPRRGEGVVGDRENAARTRDRGHRLEINHLEQGIGRRFDPDHSGIRLQRLRNLVGVRERNIREPQTCAPTADALEQPPRAAIEIVQRHDMRSAVEDFEHGGRSRHAGGKRETIGARFQRGDAAFVGPSCRIVGARVIKPLVHTRALLRVSRRRVDRRNHRARGRIGRLAGMNGKRAELVGH
jgi:hypothetical protein